MTCSVFLCKFLVYHCLPVCFQTFKPLRFRWLLYAAELVVLFDIIWYIFLLISEFSSLLNLYDVYVWSFFCHCIVKAMVFPAVMYECESWIIKKAERWRIDIFQSWCWRRLLRVPSTARRWIQSTLKEINPENSLERLMLKLYTLATWCEEPTHWKRLWC